MILLGHAIFMVNALKEALFLVRAKNKDLLCGFVKQVLDIACLDVDF